MNLFDEFVAGVANAITDIRHKVVEEPWFGRAVTDGPMETAAEQPSVWQEQLMQLRQRAHQSDLGCELPEPNHDHDIDR